MRRANDGLERQQDTSCPFTGTPPKSRYVLRLRKQWHIDTAVVERVVFQGFGINLLMSPLFAFSLQLTMELRKSQSTCVYFSQAMSET